MEGEAWGRIPGFPGPPGLPETSGGDGRSWRKTGGRLRCFPSNVLISSAGQQRRVTRGVVSRMRPSTSRPARPPVTRTPPPQLGGTGLPVGLSPRVAGSPCPPPSLSTEPPSCLGIPQIPLSHLLTRFLPLGTSLLRKLGSSLSRGGDSGGPPVPPLLQRPLLHPMPQPPPLAPCVLLSSSWDGPREWGNPPCSTPLGMTQGHPDAPSSQLLAHPPIGNYSCHQAQSLFPSSILVTSALPLSLQGGHRQTLTGPITPPSSWSWPLGQGVTRGAPQGSHFQQELASFPLELRGWEAVHL